MIKLVYLSPTMHDGTPKNPGDTKFFDEHNLESIKDLKGILSLNNPLSNKVSIVPEHQHIYQLSLTYFGLDELPMSLVYDSIEFMDSIDTEQDNSFITDTQVVSKKMVLNNDQQQLNKPEEVKEVSPDTLILQEEHPELEPTLVVEHQESDTNYSLLNELDTRRNELESTHHTKIKNLTEQYGLSYVNKDTAIKSILHKEFEETAVSLGQEDFLSNY